MKKIMISLMMVVAATTTSFAKSIPRQFYSKCQKGNCGEGLSRIGKQEV